MISASLGSSAADPRASVWVAASAGTGKTTVLTERLLRLMLDGTDPGRILCLTFTRAAAAEMANRLAAVLVDWVTQSDNALAETLRGLTGRFADAALIARARQLFALVLDTPGGIKISTIHAFCQTLLRRFPLEAGVAPEFSVIEERAAEELLAEAAQRVIIAARRGGAPELAEALAMVADQTAEERFGELMRALAQERGKLRSGAVRGRRRSAAAIVRSARSAGKRHDRVFGRRILCRGCRRRAGLRAAAEALAAGSPADRCHGAIIAAWCAASAAGPPRCAGKV